MIRVATISRPFSSPANTRSAMQASSKALDIAAIVSGPKTALCWISGAVSAPLSLPRKIAASTQDWSQVFHTDQQAGTVLIDHDKAELAQRG